MKKLGLIAIFALVAACGDSTDETKDTVEPELGAADSLRSVVQQAELAFGDAHEAEFDQDIMFHGYRFNAVETAVFNVEITQRGTSRGLDTTLFLYGADGTGNWERIAFDDDSGWGQQSRLRTIEAGEFREFMAVVGTANGMGRGNYRLVLECGNGRCEGEPVTFESCTDDVYPLFDSCVQNQLENADWGWNDSAEASSVDYCVHDGGAIEMMEWECTPTSRASYCRAEQESIKAVAPDCETRLKDAYAIYDAIEFSRLPLTEALQEQADLIGDYGNDHTWSRLDGYRVASDVTTGEVAAALRQDHSRGNALSAGDVEDRDTFRDRLYLPTEVLDVIEDEYGTEYNAVIVSGSYYVAANAEEWTTLTIVHYLESGAVFVITEVWGE